MVYVTSDGRVLQHRPWSLGRLTDVFWGAINFVTIFFQSLFNMQNANTGGSGSGNRGSRWGGGGPGGPGGPGGGSRGPRRMGTMKEIQDCSMPAGGG